MNNLPNVFKSFVVATITIAVISLICFMSRSISSNCFVIVCNNTDEMVKVELRIRDNLVAMDEIFQHSASKLKLVGCLEGGLDVAVNGLRHNVDSYICPGLRQTPVIVVNGTNCVPLFFDACENFGHKRKRRAGMGTSCR